MRFTDARTDTASQLGDVDALLVERVDHGLPDERLPTAPTRQIERGVLDDLVGGQSDAQEFVDDLRARDDLAFALVGDADAFVLDALCDAVVDVDAERFHRNCCNLQPYQSAEGHHCAEYRRCCVMRLVVDVPDELLFAVANDSDDAEGAVEDALKLWAQMRNPRDIIADDTAVEEVL